MIPLSLYIHMPWCIKKCPYCDFNSHKSPETLPEIDYVNALLDDLDADITQFGTRPIHTIFIGGGTPSLLSANAYEHLFKGLQKRLTWNSDIEITMEANPGTVEQSRFNAYRALGINRLSLGIQSFNATHLKRLGRIHNDSEAHRAIDVAKQAGFDNFNLDIMHGLPEQSINEGLLDLDAALNHQPTHLSWYQLTLEPNTIFYKTKPSLPSEDTLTDLETLGFERLANNGLSRYEISAFSRPLHQAKHNLNYWQFGDYLGIGAGAHGKVTDITSGKVYRTQKHRLPKDYLNNHKPKSIKVTEINAPSLVFEFMLNATRLEKIIPLSVFTERTGLNLDWLLPPLKQAHAKGLIELTDDYWSVTALGRRFTNDLQGFFLLDSDE